LGHRFVLSWVFFPFDKIDSAGFFQKWYTKRNCTTFVVAIGQWPLSLWSPGGRPFTVEKFYSGMSKMVRNEEIFKIGKGDIKIYLQSLHHNPLGRIMNGCTDGKPQDWRSYTEFDAYNYALREIVEQM
jgi:hypothetical protein